MHARVPRTTYCAAYNVLRRATRSDGTGSDLGLSLPKAELPKVELVASAPCAMRGSLKMLRSTGVLRLRMSSSCHRRRCHAAAERDLQCRVERDVGGSVWRQAGWAAQKASHTASPGYETYPADAHWG